MIGTFGMLWQKYFFKKRAKAVNCIFQVDCEDPAILFRMKNSAEHAVFHSLGIFSA